MKFRCFQLFAAIGVILAGLLFMVPLVRAEYVISADSVYRHIEVLADDSLEGRRVGEPGELKAAYYIQKVFERAGLEPRGTDGYLQPFEFTKTIKPGENNSLIVNGKPMKMGKEFIPLPYSGSLSFTFDEVIDVGYGIIAEEEPLKINDYEGLDVAGKAVLIRRYTPVLPDSLKSDSAQVKLDGYGSMISKINTAIEQEASGVFFIAPPDMDDTPPKISSSQVNPKDVPVVYLRRSGMERLGLDISSPDINMVSGRTDLEKVRDTAYNVVGYLPTGNDTTVIIGAHYDHLGFGTDVSLYRGDEPMIHNGADDNASGVAALLELARYYSAVKDRLHYSMLFIGFTGEEAGILGSSYFAGNMTIDSNAVRMMVNMDMIGRLKEQEGLIIFGTGSAAEFKPYFDSLTCDKFKLISRESGIGASDHTAFYNRRIPSLFLFTGAHSDYHRPTDDIEKIDPEGIVNVTGLVTKVLSHFDRVGGSLTFQKTRSDGRRGRGSYTVSLGIVPDFAAEVKGLKVDGVSADRPGERAGILTGDIIIKMGETGIGDIYDYMGALGKFRKGDSVEIVVVRGADTLSLNVHFVD